MGIICLWWPSVQEMLSGLVCACSNSLAWSTRGVSSLQSWMNLYELLAKVATQTVSWQRMRRKLLFALLSLSHRVVMIC